MTNLLFQNVFTNFRLTFSLTFVFKLLWSKLFNLKNHMQMRKQIYLTPLVEDDDALLQEGLLAASEVGLNDYNPKEWDWES